MRTDGPRLAVLDAVPSGIVVSSRSGEIVFVNRALCNLVDVSVPDLIGRALDTLLRDTEGRPLADVVAHSSSAQLAGSWRRGGAPALPVEVTSSAAVIDGDELVFSVVHDATPQRRRDAEARHRARVWRALVDHVNLAIVGLNSEGSVTLANRYFCRLVGMSEHDVVGCDWFDTFLLAEDVAHVRRVFDAVSSTGAWPVEHGRVRTHDGHVREIEWFNVQLRDADDRPSGTLSVGEDVTSRVRAEAAARASAELADVLLSDRDVGEALTVATRLSRRLVAADTATLLTVPPAADGIVVAAQDDGAGGRAAEPPLVEQRDVVVLAARGAHIVDPDAPPRLGRPGRADAQTPTIAAPLADGVLLLVRDDPNAGFTGDDVRAVAAFTAQVTLALHEARGRDEQRRADLVADRERIARDLHDTVIQRLFGLGMSLSIALSDGASSPVRNRVDSAVDELDDVISTIRSTIFRLEDPAASVLERLQDVVDDMAGHLANPPQLEFSGPVDVVPDDVAQHLPAVVREALTNVAKHADASRAVVHVGVADGWVRLRVADDGRGLAGPRPTDGDGGMGLRHLADRAVELGGHVDLCASELGGLELVWCVPLDGATDAPPVSAL